MTRETKLGLIVAGAFVSLLTVVVYHKLQENEDAAPEPAQVVRAEPKPIAPKKTGTPATDTHKPNGVVQAGLQVSAPEGPPSNLPQLPPVAPLAQSADSPMPPFKATPVPPTVPSIPGATGAINNGSPVTTAPDNKLPPVNPPPPAPQNEVAPPLPPGTTPLPKHESTLNKTSSPENKHSEVPGSGHSKHSPAIEISKVAVDSPTLAPVIQPVGGAQVEADKKKEIPALPPPPEVPSAPSVVVPPATTPSADKKDVNHSATTPSVDKKDVNHLLKEQMAKVEAQAKAAQQEAVAPLPATPTLPVLPAVSPVEKTLPGSGPGLPPAVPAAPPADISKLPPVVAPPLPTVPTLPSVDSKPLPPVSPIANVPAPLNNETLPTLPVIGQPKETLPGMKVTVPALPDASSKAVVPTPSMSGLATQNNHDGLPPGVVPYDPKKAANNSVPPVNLVRAENVGSLTNPGGLPPVGSSPHTSVSTIPVVTPPAAPTVGALPTVMVTQMQQYKCEPGDRSFIDLSQRHYGSDKYAQALLKFNRESHPVPPGIQKEPPQLEVGMEIQIPTLGRLENGYPELIPGLKPLTAVPNSTNVSSSPGPHLDAVPVINVTAPLPPVPPANAQMQQPPPAPKTVASVATAPVPEGARQYQVQGQGEMMYEIAQKTLGDGSRWPEILRLNQQVNAEYLIPAGTNLRLP